jgi:hypothetical protein
MEVNVLGQTIVNAMETLEVISVNIMPKWFAVLKSSISMEVTTALEIKSRCHVTFIVRWDLILKDHQTHFSPANILTDFIYLEMFQSVTTKDIKCKFLNLKIYFIFDE